MSLCVHPLIAFYPYLIHYAALLLSNCNHLAGNHWKCRLIGTCKSLLATTLIHCRGCDKEVPDENLVSPLLLAVIWGRADAVEALIIGGCELNTTDKDGRSAVYWAADEGHMDVLRVRLCFMCFDCRVMFILYKEFLLFFHM